MCSIGLLTVNFLFLLALEKTLFMPLFLNDLIFWVENDGRRAFLSFMLSDEKSATICICFSGCNASFKVLLGFVFSIFNMICLGVFTQPHHHMGFLFSLRFLDLCFDVLINYRKIVAIIYLFYSILS